MMRDLLQRFIISSTYCMCKYTFFRMKSCFPSYFFKRNEPSASHYWENTEHFSQIYDFVITQPILWDGCIACIHQGRLEHRNFWHQSIDYLSEILMFFLPHNVFHKLTPGRSPWLIMSPLQRNRIDTLTSTWNELRAPTAQCHLKVSVCYFHFIDTQVDRAKSQVCLEVGKGGRFMSEKLRDEMLGEVQIPAQTEIIPGWH